MSGSPQQSHLIQLFACSDAVNAWPVRYVFIDRFWERVWFLKNHADFCPQVNDIEFIRIYIHAIKFDGACNFAYIDGVVHAVEAAQSTSICRTLMARSAQLLRWRDVQINIKQCLLVAIKHIDVPCAVLHASTLIVAQQPAGIAFRSGMFVVTSPMLCSLPTSFEFLAEQTASAFMRIKKAQQHHDRRRGSGDKRALRAVCP